MLQYSTDEIVAISPSTVRRERTFVEQRVLQKTSMRSRRGTGVVVVVVAGGEKNGDDKLTFVLAHFFRQLLGALHVRFIQRTDHHARTSAGGSNGRSATGQVVGGRCGSSIHRRRTARERWYALRRTPLLAGLLHWRLHHPNRSRGLILTRILVSAHHCAVGNVFKWINYTIDNEKSRMHAFDRNSSSTNGQARNGGVNGLLVVRGKRVSFHSVVMQENEAVHIIATKITLSRVSVWMCVCVGVQAQLKVDG